MTPGDILGATAAGLIVAIGVVFMAYVLWRIWQRFG